MRPFWFEKWRMILLHALQRTFLFKCRTWKGGKRGTVKVYSYCWASRPAKSKFHYSWLLEGFAKVEGTELKFTTIKDWCCILICSQFCLSYNFFSDLLQEWFFFKKVFWPNIVCMDSVKLWDTHMQQTVTAQLPLMICTLTLLYRAARCFRWPSCPCRTRIWSSGAGCSPFVQTPSPVL